MIETNEQFRGADTRLRQLSSWLPGFEELRETEDQITELWKKLRELRAKASGIKDRLTNCCPLPLDELEMRFWTKVDIIDDETSCWEWNSGRGPAPNHYGKFKWKNPVTGKNDCSASSRVAVFLVSGVVPDHGNHTCDNPPCSRPIHLYDGTHKQNMEDRKNRHLAYFYKDKEEISEHARTEDSLKPPRRSAATFRDQAGEANPLARLTDKQVIAARRLARDGLMLKEVKAKLAIEVSDTVLRWAITGHTWKHLNEIEQPTVKQKGGSSLKGKKVPHIISTEHRKFTADEIRSIRDSRAAGYSLASLAAKYDVTAGMISQICRHHSYKDVP